MRTPLAKEFGMGMKVGLPAPAQRAMWSKPMFHGLIDGDGAAEAHPAVHGKGLAPLQQQTDDLQEVLVPAHRDAVFRNAAETGQAARPQGLADLLKGRGSA